jgi:hypothetical protein
VVISQVATENDPVAVVTRMKDISAFQFSMKLQEEEGQDGSHGEETVHYIAIEKGTATGDHIFTIGETQNVNHRWSSGAISFGDSFQNPRFLAAMQTAKGGDTAAMRYQKLSANSVETMVQEEQSRDDEIRHVGETVGWIVIGD